MNLDQLPPARTESLLPAIREELARSNRRFVVLDDDPTGTQTSNGVLVVTEWTEAELSDALQQDTPCLFVLTNSRSLQEPEAVAVAAEAGRNLGRAAKKLGVEIAVGYRGDSTLRGHYPAESWALRDAVAAELGISYDGEIIAPFFLEGGRLTVGDVHYVVMGDVATPAGETEFARDMAFGYRASRLQDWVEEKSKGAVKADTVASVSIEDLRVGGPERVEQILRSVSGGRQVVVNSVDYRDMEAFVLGLLRAEAAGKRFMYRVSASFVRVRGGMEGRPLLTLKDLYPGDAPRAAGVTIVGSHVQRTTEQLAEVLKLPGMRPVEVNVPRLLDPVTRETEIGRAARIAEGFYARGEDVAIFTSRDLVKGDSAEDSLRISASVSEGLVTIARRFMSPPRYVLAKGGITSNDIALKAFNVHHARVPGQVAPGVPCWVLTEESKFPGVPYVIFPGNVGNANTVADVITMLRG
jgi:uncharacterized protein YgbK (DUF1537 family)